MWAARAPHRLRQAARPPLIPFDGYHDSVGPLAPAAATAAAAAAAGPDSLRNPLHPRTAFTIAVDPEFAGNGGCARTDLAVFAH